MPDRAYTTGLAGVYRALHQVAAGHGVLYLSREHCELLTEAIDRLEDGTSGGSRRRFTRCMTCGFRAACKL
jgi:hypothetical protein